MPRVLIAAAVMLAVLLALDGGAAIAQDQTHEGTVVSAAEGKLVMADKDGKNEHTHMVGADAKVTVDGKAAKLSDLKKGQKVKVTTHKQGDKTAVTAIAAMSAP